MIHLKLPQSSRQTIRKYCLKYNVPLGDYIAIKIDGCNHRPKTAIITINQLEELIKHTNKRETPYVQDALNLFNNGYFQSHRTRKLTEICEKSGLSRNMLGTIRSVSPYKFAKMMSFAKDEVESVKLYLKWCRDTLKAVEDIYYTYDKPVEFSHWLQDKGFYSGQQGADGIMDGVYRQSSTISYNLKFVEKCEAIVKEWNNGKTR